MKWKKMEEGDRSSRKSLLWILWNWTYIIVYFIDSLLTSEFVTSGREKNICYHLCITRIKSSSLISNIHFILFSHWSCSDKLLHSIFFAAASLYFCLLVQLLKALKTHFLCQFLIMSVWICQSTVCENSCGHLVAGLSWKGVMSCISAHQSEVI